MTGYGYGFHVWDQWVFGNRSPRKGLPFLVGADPQLTRIAPNRETIAAMKP
jgi:hypothetical protein